MKKKALFFFMILFIGAFLLAQEFSTDFNSVLLETAFSYLNGDMAVGSPIEAGNMIIIPLYQLNSGFQKALLVGLILFQALPMVKL